MGCQGMLGGGDLAADDTGDSSAEEIHEERHRCSDMHAALILRHAGGMVRSGESSGLPDQHAHIQVAMGHSGKKEVYL